MDPVKDAAVSTPSPTVGNSARQTQRSSQQVRISRSHSQGHTMGSNNVGPRRHQQVPQFQGDPSRSESFLQPAASAIEYGSGQLPTLGLGSVFPNASSRPSASPVCPPYEAGYKAALEHIQENMKKKSVLYDNWMHGGKQDSEDGDNDSTNFFTPAAENMGSASVGLPSPCVPSIDSPLLTPPDLPLFAGVPQAVDAPLRLSSANPDWTSSPSASGGLSLSENRDDSKRTLQRRADANYAQHKKANDGKKFIIQTDEAGNILTNKLRVTSAVNSLMDRYLDVTQIHYNNEDGRFKLVEEVVRGSFEFEPPLKKNWFPDYMRKKLEKNRSEYRKYHDEKQKRHPKLTEKEYATLVSWWNSPAGSSKSGRMKEMNTERATKRRALSLSGIQNQRRPMPQIEATSEVCCVLFLFDLGFFSVPCFFVIIC